MCEQQSLVVVKLLQTELNFDYLYVGQSGQSSAESRFSGELDRRLLENGEMAVAMVFVDSNLVNITFISDHSVEREGFELHVSTVFGTHPKCLNFV